ncbi:hypothetical protein KM043_005958 [Ampulex compressa]|nr:hypothetical protein KM043_005958 [Ampulex compressa]
MLVKLTRTPGSPSFRLQLFFEDITDARYSAAKEDVINQVCPRELLASLDHPFSEPNTNLRFPSDERLGQPFIKCRMYVLKLPTYFSLKDHEETHRISLLVILLF